MYCPQQITTSSSTYCVTLWKFSIAHPSPNRHCIIVYLFFFFSLIFSFICKYSVYKGYQYTQKTQCFFLSCLLSACLPVSTLTRSPAIAIPIPSQRRLPWKLGFGVCSFRLPYHLYHYESLNSTQLVSPSIPSPPSSLSS